MYLKLYLVVILFMMIYQNSNDYSLVILTTFLQSNLSSNRQLIQMLVYKSLLNVSYNCSDIKIIIYIENVSLNIINPSINVIFCKIPKLNNFNTPYFGYLINHAIRKYNSKLYMFINGDIIISPNIRSIIYKIFALTNQKQIKANILCVATRSTILSSTYKNSNSSNHYILYNSGIKSRSCSIDVFIMTKKLYRLNYRIYNKLLVGRAGIDNVILAMALKNKNIDVIDATYSIAPIHLEDCKKCKEIFINVYSYSIKCIEFERLQI